MTETENVKGGAADHGAHTDLDAPTPPGGPLRQDAPDADVNPTGSVDPVPPTEEPDVLPSSTPDGPQVIPSPSTPEGEPGPDPFGADADSGPDADSGSDQAAEVRREQLENAGTSLDQPSS